MLLSRVAVARLMRTKCLIACYAFSLTALAILSCRGAPEIVYETVTITETVEGETCVGGMVLSDGTCIAKCDPNVCLPGNTCVNNECVLECLAHHTCPYGQACVPALEDDTERAILICADHGAGALGVACDDDGDCDTGLVCAGDGPEGAGGECASVGCVDDDECPGGFYCGATRRARLICGLDKGGDQECGTSTEVCIEPVTLPTADGLFDGPWCLMQRVCRRRAQCAPCDTDLDCSVERGFACTQVAGEGRCGTVCSEPSHCPRGDSCVDGVCVPTAGGCRDSGCCERCLDDTDCDTRCGPASDFDRSLTCLGAAPGCLVDTDCPTAPSGLHGTCLDERFVSSDHARYQTCYLPMVESEHFSCWP